MCALYANIYTHKLMCVSVRLFSNQHVHVHKHVAIYTYADMHANKHILHTGSACLCTFFSTLCKQVHMHRYNLEVLEMYMFCIQTHGHIHIQIRRVPCCARAPFT
jgi:hypothetical protein